ncbi:hypothetical protein ABIC08_006345 [Bradyrhizobium sp. RT9b]|uniref:hypothetical protein n=1 Tax=Bradyrhizobium sp. RT9b TaxID=3156385 RepID=UPI003397736D
MPKPVQLASHEGGDTREAHLQNVNWIKKYLEAIRQDGRGLPADCSSPKTIYWKRLAEESGVKLISLNRAHSQCRKLVLDSLISDQNPEGLEIRVRVEPRVRPVYTIDEAIHIAVAVIQSHCEKAKEKHRPKCARVDDLLREIARRAPKGLCHDSIVAISVELEHDTFPEDAELLNEIKDILLSATRGELELQTFHGRLKLEAALAGFSMSGIAKVTTANVQTVINWAAGVKTPDARLKEEIPKIEKALRLSEGYLSKKHVSNRSGQSSVKRRYLPAEILALSPTKQKKFRRLFEEGADLSKLSAEELSNLMSEKLDIFRRLEDSIDQKRAKLRLEMKYALKELPPSLQEEFEQLVKYRSNEIVLYDVPAKDKGWDPDTIKIYHDRFRQFFGWMHHTLKVPKENLSISYFAFRRVLKEYGLYLVERKEQVGMEKRPANSLKEWFTFASSLTRRQAELRNPKTKIRELSGAVGWLRRQRELLKKIVPINDLSGSDAHEVSQGERDDVLPILTEAELLDAAQEWADLLDQATEDYRFLAKRLHGQTSDVDSVHRVGPILRLENPLRAIEIGVCKASQKIATLRPGSRHWYTAIRDCVAVKFHAQVPLRRQTFCGLTYLSDNTGMVYKDRKKWWLRVPAELFKNEKSRAFKDLTPDGFYTVTLEDKWGLYTDLEIYINEARDGVLSGVQSGAFYVARHNSGHVTPGTFAGTFRRFTENFIAENPGRKTGFKGVKSFGSQAMRHIVATAVFAETRDIHAAARAIHDSAKTTNDHYNKYFESIMKRAKTVHAVLGPAPDSPIVWPIFSEGLPVVSSPSIAPVILEPYSNVEDIPI